MIKINNITRGRFGNRILQYNSAYQLATKLNTGMQCDNWEGDDFFDLSPLEGTDEPGKEERLFTWRECVDPSWDNINKAHEKFDLAIDDPAYLLHNTFFQLTHVDLREFIKVKQKFLPQFDEGTVNVGIHIRGGDIRGADNNNGREIHTFEYYKKAIDEVLAHEKIDGICITTDDPEFELFKDVGRYSLSLSDSVNVYVGAATLDQSFPHIYDFALLSECDYLIASSSTYAICAGLLGKEKKIIHSLEWIKKSIPGPGYFDWGNRTADYPDAYWKSWDNFWLKVYDGGNDFYKAWKIL
jgi:hypothetical protein